jgi:hypothetical protein
VVKSGKLIKSTQHPERFPSFVNRLMTVEMRETIESFHAQKKKKSPSRNFVFVLIWRYMNARVFYYQFSILQLRMVKRFFFFRCDGTWKTSGLSRHPPPFEIEKNLPPPPTPCTVIIGRHDCKRIGCTHCSPPPQSKNLMALDGFLCVYIGGIGFGNNNSSPLWNAILGVFSIGWRWWWVPDIDRQFYARPPPPPISADVFVHFVARSRDLRMIKTVAFSIAIRHPSKQFSFQRLKIPNDLFNKSFQSWFNGKCKETVVVERGKKKGSFGKQWPIVITG